MGWGRMGPHPGGKGETNVTESAEAPSREQVKSMAAKQRRRLLQYLLQGNQVDRFIADRELAIYELSARVVELENAGAVFLKGWFSGKNKFDEPFRMRTYRLVFYQGVYPHPKTT